MSFSPQQGVALQRINAWANDKKGPQIMRVFGWAGTGKTTLARQVDEDLGGGSVYMTYTGKGALVMRKKGCIGASTIHGAIYKPQEDPITGHTTFSLNPESSVAAARLVIADEVSMADEIIGKDLLSFGTKILALGDPFQLPPPTGNVSFFTGCEPDIMLTEIHRQAADNPIIRLSIDVREGRGLTLGDHGQCKVLSRATIGKDGMRELVEKAEQLLCGSNKIRQSFNARIRDIQKFAGRTGMASHIPVVGERLVCLKNNHGKGLLNGGLWLVDKVNKKIKAPKSSTEGFRVEMVLTSIDEPGTAAVEVAVPDNFFLGTEAELDWRVKKNSDQFTFGYALTVHKAQGSQWDDVLLYDESKLFREHADRHLYTGLTRAAETLTVVV